MTRRRAANRKLASPRCGAHRRLSLSPRHVSSWLYVAAVVAATSPRSRSHSHRSSPSPTASSPPPATLARCLRHAPTRPSLPEQPAAAQLSQPHRSLSSTLGARSGLSRCCLAVARRATSLACSIASASASSAGPEREPSTTAAPLAACRGV